MKKIMADILNKGLPKLGIGVIVAGITGWIVFWLTIFFVLPQFDTNKVVAFGTIMVAVATFMTVLVALYYGSWKVLLKRAKLKVCFDQTGKAPYFMKPLAYGVFQTDYDIELDGQRIFIRRPAFNARVKILNYGTSTAKKVQARIEKVVLCRRKLHDTVIDYHPTAIQWSGEFDWRPVDIAAKSFFFMDLFRVVNETSVEVVDFNHDFFGCKIEKAGLRDIIEREIGLSKQVYWNVWVEAPADRGLPPAYTHEGKILLYFIVNGEGFDSLKFTTEIHWTRAKWDQPMMRVFWNGKMTDTCD